LSFIQGQVAFFTRPLMTQPIKTSVSAGLFLGVVLLLSGCGDNSNKSAGATNSSGSVATAPADYLGAVTRGEQSAIKVVDTAQLRQAVQMFNVDHGRNPKDLDELVKEKYIPVMPPVPHGTKLSYDPATGEVRVVKE
jgi:hypothetical protein